MHAIDVYVARTALVVALLMLLFPPWYTRAQNGLRTNLGYDLVASAPSDRAEIDLARLMIQLVVVGGLTFGFIKLR